MRPLKARAHVRSLPLPSPSHPSAALGFAAPSQQSILKERRAQAGEPPRAHTQRERGVSVCRTPSGGARQRGASSPQQQFQQSLHSSGCRCRRQRRAAQGRASAGPARHAPHTAHSRVQQPPLPSLPLACAPPLQSAVAAAAAAAPKPLLPCALPCRAKPPPPPSPLPPPALPPLPQDAHNSTYSTHDAQHTHAHIQKGKGRTEPARRDVRREHDRVLAALELGQHPVALALLLVAVQAERGVAVGAQRARDVVAAALRLAEHEHLGAGAVDLGDLLVRLFVCLLWLVLLLLLVFEDWVWLRFGLGLIEVVRLVCSWRWF